MPFNFLQLRLPGIFSAYYPVLVAAESTRHGGVSRAPYQSLNLGLHTADRPENIRENRRRFFAACGFLPEQTAGSHQVHGSEVWVVEKPGYTTGYDALITRRPQVLLTVTVADCTPILIFDPVQRAVAAVHAGWKGTVAGIVQRTLLTMQEAFGTDPAHCAAYIGTCIDQCDFEVDADVADHFKNTHKIWDSDRQKFMVDLKQANREQLLSVGLKEDRIELSPFSTFTETDHYFSHRRDRGQTGRMLAAIGLR